MVCIIAFYTHIHLLDVAGCDVTLTVTETKEYVATEGYPNNYKHNQDCEFNFMAPSGRKIIVQFEDFHLEFQSDYLYFRKLDIMDTHMQLMVIGYVLKNKVLTYMQHTIIL